VLLIRLCLFGMVSLRKWNVNWLDGSECNYRRVAG